MKNVATRICAALLLGWYLMSIIGFDVHTCADSGRSFIATFVQGMTCEDIHPGHHDRHCCCAHQEETCCSISVDTKSCCTDDYQVLCLTGERPDDDHRHYDECVCGHCPCVADIHPAMLPTFLANVSLSLSGVCSGLIADSGIRVLISVWRI